MAILVVLNVLAAIFSVAILREWMPVGFLGGLIIGLHQVVGITTPSEKQVRWAIVAWVVSLVVILDVLVLLLVYVF